MKDYEIRKDDLIDIVSSSNNPAETVDKTTHKTPALDQAGAAFTISLDPALHGSLKFEAANHAQHPNGLSFAPRPDGKNPADWVDVTRNSDTQIQLALSPSAPTGQLHSVVFTLWFVHAGTGAPHGEQPYDPEIPNVGLPK